MKEKEKELEREIKEIGTCFEKLKEERLVKISRYQRLFNLSFPSFLFLFFFSIYPLTNFVNFSIIHAFSVGLCIFASQQSIRYFNYLSIHKRSLKHLDSFCNSINESINKSQLKDESE